MQAFERPDSHPGELLQPGDVLGRYQLLCPIARGGMGQVWAARQTGRLGLPKLVAIKTAIPLESKDYQQVQEYLFDEAQVASSVDHPNVCKILELGQERDVLFIAMEWLNGVPLSSLITKIPQRRLDYRMAAHLVAQACSGLHAAHELTDDDGVNLEVVHRDATPHNFMITASGELKVMDFGIVKSKNQQHQATQTGELKGKLAYLAPEQIRGRRVDRRADIFTLGCVLYFITVGRGAFNPDHDQDAGLTIHRILEGAFSPPSSLLSDYPQELEAIVARALAVAPDQRFQTAEEMRRALESFLDSGSRSVSREDVAAIVQEYCGSTIEQRRTEIRHAQRMFDSGSGQMRSGAFPAASAPSNAALPITPDAQGNADLPFDWSRSSPLPTFISGTPLKRNRTLLWVGLAVGALLVVVLVVAAALLTSPREAGLPVAAKTTDAPPLLQQPVTAKSPSLDSVSQGAAQAAQLPLEAPPQPRTSSETAAKTSRKATPLRAAARVAPAPAATSAVGSEATSAPPAPSSQFTQTLSRKPRHAIDESDPFGK